ncbi:MAG TPA: hypothetical protein VEQ85_11550, partial [Lacipirellulaceae bacterium]|nr:hypothetical protein [Lacipirellulaceae bacterium]
MKSLWSIGVVACVASLGSPSSLVWGQAAGGPGAVPPVGVLDDDGADAPAGEARLPGAVPSSQPSPAETAAGAQTNPSPPASNYGPTSSAAGSTPGSTASPDQLEAERLRIWSSPRMVEARQWVSDYGQRSARFTSQDAARYLEWMRQLSPTDMNRWLDRYDARRAQLARAAEVARAARQASVSQALERQQGFQQARDTAVRNQTAGALLARDRIAQQQMQGHAAAAAQDASRNALLSQQNARDFSWIIFPSRRTRAFAAATLPGDLPAGDPRNFARGEGANAAAADIVGPEGEPLGVVQGLGGGRAIGGNSGVAAPNAGGGAAGGS